MSTPHTGFFKYLPPSPSAKAWGLSVLDAGYTLIPANSSYPPELHPSDHMFNWEKGRILDSYTFVYISRGEGVFESKSSGLLNIDAGDLFVIYPREWHRYRPHAHCGWDEYWVEFSGDYGQRIMSHDVFSPECPVHSLGHCENILHLFVEISKGAQSQKTGFEQIIAAQTTQMVAQILAMEQSKQKERHSLEKIIQLSQLHILKHMDEEIDFKTLARQMSISYSAFRQNFKKITGLPPNQYQIQIRLNKAKSLLHNTTLSIDQVAHTCGFDSIHYFSRLFKSKLGLSPLAFRKNI
jgi:AraC-like DNA-binding protein